MYRFAECRDQHDFDKGPVGSTPVNFSPCRIECSSRNINDVQSFLKTGIQLVESFSHGRQDQFTLHCQNNGWMCPGESKNKGLSKHDIETFSRNFLRQHPTI